MIAILTSISVFINRSIMFFSNLRSTESFAIHEMRRTFLLHIGGTIVERPQHMFMRIAVATHGSNIEHVLETYGYLSRGFYMHSSLALMTAGIRDQCPSSGLMFPADCSTKESMHSSVQKCAVISKYTTGIGMSLHTVPTGWYILTSLVSYGALFILLYRIKPLIHLIDATAPFLGEWHSCPSAVTTIYLEPWHPDILTALAHHGSDLIHALWIPDLLCVDLDYLHY